MVISSLASGLRFYKEARNNEDQKKVGLHNRIRGGNFDQYTDELGYMQLQTSQTG